MSTFACLGFEWLGQCAYNPGAPPTYFTLGDAVAAIGVTILLQQFMKPVFRLRLAVRYLSLRRLYGMVFAGAGLVLIGDIIPQIPALHAVPLLGYELFWEILGTILFATVYLAIALTVVWPIKIWPARMNRFASELASRISEASEDDMAPMVEDVQASLPLMVELTAWIETHRDEPSSFYMFTNRAKIAQGQHARALLRIIADPAFSRVMVKRTPWRVSAMLDKLAELELHARAAEPFLQELAHQAIIDDGGFLSRERGYHGFGVVPHLSRSLFSDPFIVYEYDPLGVHFLGQDVSFGVLERFSRAAERVVDTVVKAKRFDYPRPLYSVERFYESAGMQAWTLRQGGSLTWQFALPLCNAVTMMIKEADRVMALADDRVYEQLFTRSENDEHHDTLEPLVKIVVGTLSKVSTGFTSGPGDSFWMMGMDVMHRCFGSIGDQPDGMNPFQQRVALGMIEQLERNMDGWYPALCRMMLAIVGPYQQPGMQQNETAFRLLHRAMWVTLKRFPDLAAGRPDKLRDYLPDNVSYDAEGRTLTHTYADGRTNVSDIGAVTFEPVDFCDKKIMRKLTDDERQQAKVDDP